MAKDDRFSMSRNFLATDKVPDTIFGIPVVSSEEDYTPEDIAFFHEHPEAGGYYDLGEGSPEDGTEEGMPTQADAAGNAWERAQAEAQRRKQAILEGRLEPTAAEEQLYDMTEVRRARQERLRREKAKMGPGGRKSDDKGGNAAEWADKEDRDAAVRFIAKHEGFRGQAGRDRRRNARTGKWEEYGPWTYGHGLTTRPDGTPVQEGDTIDEATSMSRVREFVDGLADRYAKMAWAKGLDRGAVRAALDLGYQRPRFYSEGMSRRMASAADRNMELHDTYMKYAQDAGTRARRLDGHVEFFGGDPRSRWVDVGGRWSFAPMVAGTSAPSLPAKKRKASGGSTRSEGDR